MDTLVVFYGTPAEIETFKPASNFATWEDFIAKNQVPNGFIIGSAEPHHILELLKKLRANPTYALKPIFTVALPEAKNITFIDALADGQIASHHHAITKINEIEQLRQRIPREDAALSETQKIIAYLYTRPYKKLTPIENWQLKELFEYPLATAFTQNKEARVWLEDLVRRDLLRHSKIVDRLRICPFCSASHLSYIDICPTCQSIDIREESLLHCFVCGNIAPQENFLQGNQLRCPQCSTVLHHIGSDYDRPLENFICNQCKSKFIDPEVIAKCTVCNKTMHLNELVTLSLYEYELSDFGKTFIESGRNENLFEAFDTINYVSIDFFYVFMDWLIKLVQRHDNIYFSVIGINFPDINDYIAKVGFARVEDIINKGAERIQKLIRTTDILTRTENNKIWLLLPQTDNKGVNILAGRIQDLHQEITREDKGLSQLKIKTLAVTINHAEVPEKKAQMLLAELTGELDNV